MPFQEATVAYSFIPADAFAGRPIGLTINLAYRDLEGNFFFDPVFNETVQVTFYNRLTISNVNKEKPKRLYFYQARSNSLEFVRFSTFPIWHIEIIIRLWSNSTNLNRFDQIQMSNFKNRTWSNFYSAKFDTFVSTEVIFWSPKAPKMSFFNQFNWFLSNNCPIHVMSLIWSKKFTKMTFLNNFGVKFDQID